MQITPTIYKIANALQISTAAFTAAVTDIITSNAHGLSNGDRVVLTTTDTLPAGLATATVYTVLAVTTNTFKLSTEAFTPDIVSFVDITDTGTGTHTFTEHDVTIPFLNEGYRNSVVTLHFDASANFKAQVQISNQEDAPDFSAAKSATNSYDEVSIIDLEDNAGIDGDTGITKAGAADDRNAEININSARWVSIIMPTWTAGTLTAFIKVSDNG